MKKAKVRTKKVAPTSGPPGERSPEDKVRDQFATLGVMAKAHIAKLDAERDMDRRHEKASEDGPMMSAPVWHVHRR